MNWRTLHNRSKIIQIFQFLIVNQIEIIIRFNGKKTEFTTKFMRINPKDTLSDAGEKFELIIDKLTPQKGNTIIQSSPKIHAEFSIRKRSCRCILRHIGTSNTYPYFGYILDLPESIEITEKRREERFTYEKPEFVSVEFLSGGNLYECEVLDCSKYGLGIIIPPEHFDLLSKLDVGDKLADIKFFATWTMITVNGTVRHKTKITEGRYTGSYILGIESPEIIDNCKPKNM